MSTSRNTTFTASLKDGRSTTGNHGGNTSVSCPEAPGFISGAPLRLLATRSVHEFESVSYDRGVKLARSLANCLANPYHAGMNQSPIRILSEPGSDLVINLSP